jgi:hypothetical protein
VAKYPFRCVRRTRKILGGTKLSVRASGARPWAFPSIPSPREPSILSSKIFSFLPEKNPRIVRRQQNFRPQIHRDKTVDFPESSVLPNFRGQKTGCFPKAHCLRIWVGRASAARPYTAVCAIAQRQILNPTRTRFGNIEKALKFPLAPKENPENIRRQNILSDAEENPRIVRWQKTFRTGERRSPLGLSVDFALSGIIVLSSKIFSFFRPRRRQ